VFDEFLLARAASAQVFPCVRELRREYNCMSLSVFCSRAGGTAARFPVAQLPALRDAEGQRTAVAMTAEARGKAAAMLSNGQC
jgi:hypothetical protein